jgi:hypothetical protein
MGNPFEMEGWFLKKVNSVWSNTKIDIIIPSLNKDLDVLPYVVEGARQYIKHPIHNIFIVSPDDYAIKEFCKNHGCIHIDENIPLPITKAEIDYTVNGIDRSGWLLQQFIKLSGDHVSEQEHYLVIDSDTVFIRPNCFERRGRVIFHTADEYHPPYFTTYEKLLGMKPASSKSFCTHYMLFEKLKVAALKKTIEDRWNIPWHEAILKNIDRTTSSGFADYETYGNFVMSTYPGYVRLKYWRNKSLRRPLLGKTMEQQTQKLSRRYNTLSFHSWNTSW